MGAMHQAAVPWLSGPPLRQLEELAAWGDMLKAGMVVAFTADVSEVHLEGAYRLALLNEARRDRPTPGVPESQVHATPTLTLTLTPI